MTDDLLNGATPAQSHSFKEPPTIISLALTALFALVIYALFRIFSFFGQVEFFENWVFLFIRGFVVVSAVQVLNPKSHKGMFLHVVLWGFVSRIPIFNLIPLFIAGQYWAQRSLGYR